jgi:hypothetical protein
MGAGGLPPCIDRSSGWVDRHREVIVELVRAVQGGRIGEDDDAAEQREHG